MEVCIKDLVLLEELVLRLNRLLDLNDHLSLVPYAGSVGKDGSAGSSVLAVLKPGTNACRCFDDDLTAGIDIRLYIVRRQTHAEFIVFDLFYQSDNHVEDLLGLNGSIIIWNIGF